MRCGMKMRRASANAVETASGLEMARFRSHRVQPSQEDLLVRLDRANKTIRTLEQRVAMQERTYMVAMREKNQKIRELELSLQGRH